MYHYCHHFRWLNAIKSQVMSATCWLMLTGKPPAVSFFCIKSTRPWLQTASWKHGLLQHLCFGFPIRVTLVTLQTLNKTSTTKLSINFINLVTSWQHMATFQSTTTRTYQDRTCRVCPTRWSPWAVPRGFLRRRL